MSDFNVKIVAIDSAMDAVERYARECADITAHIAFDMRSLFERLEQEVISARESVESLESRMDELQANLESEEQDRRESAQEELEEVYQQLCRAQLTLEQLENLAIRTRASGTALLDRFRTLTSSGCALAEDAVRFMGRYIHDLNLVCNRQVLSFGTYRSSEGYYVCVVDSALYPSTAEHIRAAQNMGYPTRLTVDREGAAQRRDESLQGVAVRSEFDRDEYPMALFLEGGAGADVAYLEGPDNRGTGSYVGWQLRGVPDGAEVRIRVI